MDRLDLGQGCVEASITRELVMGVEDEMHQVAVANRMLAELGLASGITASLGHVSIRCESNADEFIVKGRGYENDTLSFMRDDDMVVCDLDGFKVAGPKMVTQCTEVQLHACIYKTHPDVRSIVHVHPRFTVLASVLQKPIVPMCREGAELVSRPIPIYPHYKLILSPQDGMEVAETLGDSRVALLEGHGAVTTGVTARESVMSMYQLEEQARMNWYAYCAAGPDHRRISTELLDEERNAQPTSELVHFQRSERGDAAKGADRGVWSYHTYFIERKMEAESVLGEFIR